MKIFLNIVALILFIITAAAGQKYKNNDIKTKGK